MKKALLGIGLLGSVGALVALQATRRGGGYYSSNNSTRVVVLGAGFGGLAAARTLARNRDGLDLDVLLVDRANFHLFTPILYQVATGGVEPDNVTHPVRYATQADGFRFQESNVQKISVEDKCVYTDDGPIYYDYLVVALGATNNFFGLASAEENSFTLKTISDGIELRNHIIDAFERAEVEQDPEVRRRLLTFVIVGAGPTGVELAASLRDLASHVLLKEYPGIDPGEVRVVLVEALDRILLALDDQLRQNAMKTLQSKGVEVLLNTPVADVERGGVRIKDGSFIPSETVVWTAGVKANPLIADLPGEKGRDGRVRVNDFMQLPDHPEIYVIGDCAMYFMPGEQRPLPPNAPVAIAGGKTAAINIIHTLRNEPLEPLKYKYQGELVSLGKNNAVANIMGIKFSGFIGWLVWRAVYLYKLEGFKNKASVLVDWLFGVFDRRETSKLPVTPSKVPSESVAE